VSRSPIYHEVLIAGFGGQGAVLAGRLIAVAALDEGREVVWAPSYGPEMRGGSVHCTVIISSERIGSPEVSAADTLLLMDRGSFDRFSGQVKPGSLLVLNSTLVAPPAGSDCEMLLLPATAEAEALGDARVANVIMLGAFLTRRPVVASESIVAAMKAVAGGARARLLEINLKALARGAELAG
jgi:2-oxoglutarate ferredoxin oxidoreductase subunit gamma